MFLRYSSKLLLIMDLTREAREPLRYVTCIRQRLISHPRGRGRDQGTRGHRRHKHSPPNHQHSYHKTADNSVVNNNSNRLFRTMDTK